jgi:quinol monooxygenase YgiN
MLSSGLAKLEAKDVFEQKKDLQERKLPVYGTVARLRLKPGKEAEFQTLGKSFEQAKVPGVVAQYVYRMDANPNELYLAVVLTDKAAYERNAASPEQNARFQQMMTLLESEPEWHDGEVIFSAH